MLQLYHLLMIDLPKGIFSYATYVKRIQEKSERHFNVNFSQSSDWRIKEKAFPNLY